MERKIQCLLGHGECPQGCFNHSAAKKTTDEFGVEIDPYFSRLAIIFGDVNHNVHPADVAAAMENCIKETASVSEEEIDRIH